MADIETELKNFKSAIYGEDVRDSMVSAITAINDEAEEVQNFADDIETLQNTVAYTTDNHLGTGATATYKNGIAIGTNASATSNYSTAIGYNANTTSSTGIAIGYNANSDGGQGIAIGCNASSPNNHGIAIGGGSSVAGPYEIVIGQSCTAEGNYSIALGQNANVTSEQSIAIGGDAKVYAASCVALGHGAKASGNYSTALGRASNASGGNSTALGQRAVCANANGMQLGNASTLSSLTCGVDLTVTSDERDKADITPIADGALDFLQKITPIQYVSNKRELYIDEDNLSDEDKEKKAKYGLCAYDTEAHAAGEKKGERLRVGVSAQETQQALEDIYGTADYANLVNDNLYDFDDIPEDVESQLAVDYAAFTPFLIKALQELAVRVEELEAQLETAEETEEEGEAE